MIAYHPLNLNETNDSDQALIHFEPAILFGQETQDLCSIFISGDQCYVLELEIKDIAFTHHPLFCREHVLANKLCRLYEQYEYRLEAAITKRLISKLRALRTARDNLIKIMSTERNADMIAVHKERLTKYKIQIQEIRKQRILEGKNDNALIMNLLSTWKDLKRMRALQGYTSSNVKLVILKSDHVHSTQEWQNEIKSHVEETLEEMKETQNYDEENLSENYASIEGDRENRRDSASSTALDLKAIHEKAVEDVSESMPAPEEQTFVVSLTQQEITSDNELTNSMEIQRRSLISRSRIWFRIFYNGHEVCKSSPQTMERHFSCVFNQKFSIRVQEWPATLSIQIFCDGVPSKGIFSEHPLAEIFLPIPHSGATLENVPLEKYEFSSTDEVGIGVRHSGVGSGVPFKLFSDDDKMTCCYTTACITCKTAWAANNERVLSPPEYYFNKINARRQTTESTTKNQSDTSVLKQWLKTVQLDPNDPTNVPLFELLKKADKNSEEVQKCFNVDSAQKMFDFCSEDEMTANPRFKLLSLRDRGEMEFKNAKTVPLREWEIPKDMFKNYEKRVSSPELPFDTIGLGQLEIHRAWGEHSLSMLYDRILKLCKLSQLHRSTPDVIQEEKVPDIGTLGLTFMKLLQPKRPLRPRRKGRKRIPVKGLTGQEVKVIVNVVRAFEVPIRKDVDTLTEDNISYVPVRPFVEVTFKGQTKRTVTADGPNPTWNQDLHFSLMGPNDGSFQVSNMQSFGDSLHIHLFDEIIVDILEDERIRDTTIHQRLDRNWLGSLRIPFSTLYFNHQVEGTFQLYSPPFLLGYDRQVSLASSEQSHLRNSTFLTLFIIVQPPLSPPDPIMENLECSEPPYLEQYLELWAKEVSREVPHRPVKTLVTDGGGKSVCVTRFFRAISPPVIYENENTTPEMIARYVSLIPVSTSGALLFGHFNVWLTCDQTIRLLLGEREDHAILLCCFLMKLGLKAWLLFGNGIPHGHSAYVLTRHDAPLMTPVYNIWDSVTGLKYSSMDSFSPLHKVYCLINDENIWINIQKEELIRRTNFDVSQRSDWWPAFGKQIPPPTNSVQPDSIEYTFTSNTDVHLLQDKIEKYLRDSIMKWRPTSRYARHYLYLSSQKSM
ncbi:coiled-coil and C2 domain-containing protein 2A [Planococcus citri]|uniref:coiled-coil and C2 domain-containing protein 2A n=1 Tax=Planococcus citri TaxID=170843 RepID=UPI0031F818C2